MDNEDFDDELFGECCVAINAALEDVKGIKHVSSNCYGEFLIVLDDGRKFEFEFEPSIDKG